MEVDFPVTNDSNERVRYKVGATSCSCSTVAFLDKDELGPGEKSVVRMSIRMAGRVGPQLMRTNIEGNNGVRHIFEARVKVFPRASVSQSVLTFSDVAPEKECGTVINFETRGKAGSKPPTLLGVRAHSSFVDAHAQEVAEIKEDSEELPGRKWEITIRLKPAIDADGQTVVACRYEDGEGEREVGVLVTWRVRNLFTVEPKRLFWRATNDSRIKDKKQLRIKRVNGAPFQVRRIKTFTQSLRCTVTGSENNEHLLTVALEPTNLTNSLHGFLDIETDVAAQPVIKVPVAVFAVMPDGQSVDGRHSRGQTN